MKDEADLDLDALCETVGRELRRRGLIEAQPDGRVSPAPDPRTVRYYATLGLVDRPKIVDRQARYGRRQVLQLLAIKALQGASFPLADVQARLYGLSDRELEALLDALAEERRRRPFEVRPVRWREVTVVPGLKILAEDGWTVTSDLSFLLSKVGAAVAALGNAPSGAVNGGTKS